MSEIELHAEAHPGYRGDVASVRRRRMGAGDWGTASLVTAALGLTAVVVHSAPVYAGETEVAERLVASVPAASEDACVESGTVLCLHEGRYEVTVEFTANNETTPARVARPRTDDSGLFYFFAPNNWEMLLKVLDACPVNGHHWVFAATASDVGIKLVVRDTTLPDTKDDGTMNINLREYTFPPIARRPQRTDESDEDYARDVLAKGHPALTEVGAFPDACPATS